jgi:hypothetical protein
MASRNPHTTKSKFNFQKIPFVRVSCGSKKYLLFQDIKGAVVLEAGSRRVRTGRRADILIHAFHRRNRAAA